MDYSNAPRIHFLKKIASKDTKNQARGNLMPEIYGTTNESENKEVKCKEPENYRSDKEYSKMTATTLNLSQLYQLAELSGSKH